jgi:hypothetical protein
MVCFLVVVIPKPHLSFYLKNYKMSGISSTTTNIKENKIKSIN